MGLDVLSIEIANAAAPDRREPIDFLVDSGAVYSFVPRTTLERLGIAAHSQQRFRLADGSTLDRERGDALFFYKGHRGAAPVIFAESGDATLLGAVTLESLGFVLDAVRRDRLPLPMVVGGAIDFRARDVLSATSALPHTSGSLSRRLRVADDDPRHSRPARDDAIAAG